MATAGPSTTCQVRVGVRIRPLTSQEIKQGGKQVLDVAPPSVGIGERRFTYDAVFDSHIAQEELYESVSRPLLASFVDGYNATVSFENEPRDSVSIVFLMFSSPIDYGVRPNRFRKDVGSGALRS